MAEAHTTTYSLEYMKKYLTYVRSSVHPALTKPAADILKSFYLTLR
jgi:DNA replicative helicase MCM subunit Mcm2 (Cdc46/Mcm family)